MPTDCVFCSIADKSLASEIIYESEEILVIPDIKPRAPIHMLVIPKKHIDSLVSLADLEIGLLGKLLDVARRSAAKRGLDSSGYKVVINVGSDGGQVVPHLHLHVLGGKKLRDQV